MVFYNSGGQQKYDGRKNDDKKGQVRDVLFVNAFGEGIMNIHFMDIILCEKITTNIRKKILTIRYYPGVYGSEKVIQKKNF